MNSKKADSYWRAFSRNAVKSGAAERAGDLKQSEKYCELSRYWLNRWYDEIGLNRLFAAVGL